MKQIPASACARNILLLICFLCVMASLTMVAVVRASQPSLPAHEQLVPATALLLTADEQEWVRDNPLIRVSILDVPPYHFWENGPRGISVDILNRIAAKAGFTVQYLHGDMSWPDSVANIRNHTNVDLLPTVKRTPEREGFMLFSEDYLDLPWVIFTRRDEASIFSLEDLFGKTIALEKGYEVQQRLAREFPQIKQKLVAGATEALSAVSENQVDAYIGNLTVSQYHISHLGFNNLKVAAPTNLGSHNFAFAIRDDWPLLVSILNKGLNSISQEESSAITRKYFSLQVEQKVDYRRLLWIAGAIVLLICLILLWNRLLHNKVREHTSKFQKELDLRRRSEAQYRRLIDSLAKDYIFYTLDPKGIFTYVSASAFDMMGYLSEEAVGQHFSIFHTAASQQAIAYTEAGLRGEKIPMFEAELRHRDGTLMTIEATESPIFDKQGDLIALEGLLHNITGRKQTELELQKYREKLETLVSERTLELQKLSRAVEQSHSTIVITDVDGIIEFVNPAFTRVSGYTEEEALGKTPKILQSKNHPVSFYQSMWDTLTAGKVWRGEINNKRKDGSLYWDFVTISPVKNQSGKTTHYVAVQEDISSLKETEQQLILAQQEAEAANQAKSDFLANMSHDIRTPMNGIIGLTNLVLETELSPEQRKQLESIQLSANGLLGLLNDILDFSKIEAGQLLIEKKDFSLAAIWDSISATMVHAAKSKGLELIIDGENPELPLFMKGDELRLRQILTNLVGNSIKFSKEGAVIVKVLPEKRKDTRVGLHFVVIDTGIGIPTDKHVSVFTSFNQADTSITREFGGTGLGLAISKQLVELMEGEIWIENNTPRGTIFHFTVVLDRGSEKVHLQLESTVSPTQKLKILLVDDNSINCEIAANALEKNGHQVVSAQNGLVALGLLSTHYFDLIVMDVQMPIMDGLQASTIIRAVEEGKDLSRFDLPQSLPERLAQQCKGRSIPIIAMTANAMEGDKEKCLQAGMDNYLTKPFEPAQLRAIVADMVAAPAS